MNTALRLSHLTTALREAGTKINSAVRELKQREDEAASWMQRFIHREVAQRTRTRGPAYWDAQFPGLTPEQRAERRIQRMVTRATIAGVAAAAGATAAEVTSLVGQGSVALAALPLGLASVGAEMVYTTALQIDLAFDLASIYGVAFSHDDIGEISTLLGLALGVELVREPTRHDQPAAAGETKPWRVIRQMQRDDFSQRLSRELIQQSLLRNLIPVVSVLLSAVWNQVVLRRFANRVHTTIRQRLAIVRACRGLHLGQQGLARTILDGAWLIATSDGEVAHREALALSTLIDSLTLPERLAVSEASFPDDEEDWFERVTRLEPQAQELLLDVLAIVASADGMFSAPKRRFLRRLARTLKREIDLAEVEDLAARVRAGATMPGPAELAARVFMNASPSTA